LVCIENVYFIVRNFRGCQFRGWASLIDFAGIKFREFSKANFSENQKVMDSF